MPVMPRLQLLFLERLPIYIAFIVLFFGIYLRVTSISSTWFSVDEGLYLVSANSAIADFVPGLNYQAHPPGYFLFLKLLHRFFFFESYDFRWISFIFGIAAISVHYSIGKLLGGRAIGVVAAAISSISTALIIQSQIVRPYSLLMLLVSLILFEVLRFDNGRRVRAGLYIGLYCLIGMFLHYAFFIVSFVVLIGFIVHYCTILYPSTKNILRLFLFSLCIPSVVGGSLVILFAEQLHITHWIEVARTGYLSSYFQYSFSEYTGGIFDLLFFLFNFPVGFIYGFLFIIGIFVLIRRKKWLICVICGGVFLLHSILTFLGLYPFAGTRHVVHIFPCMLVPVLFAVHWIITYHKSRPTTLMLSMLLLLLLPYGGRHISLYATSLESGSFLTVYPLTFESPFSRGDFAETYSRLKTITNKPSTILLFSPSAFYQLYPAIQSDLTVTEGLYFSGSEVFITNGSITARSDINNVLLELDTAGRATKSDIILITGEWDSKIDCTYDRLCKKIAPNIFVHLINTNKYTSNSSS